MNRPFPVVASRESAADFNPTNGAFSRDTAAGSERRWRPLWLALGFVALTGFVRLAAHWHLHLPQCWTRQITGLPCPACGSTRSLQALGNFDFAQAFLLNPLLVALGVALLAWSITSAMGWKAFTPASHRYGWRVLAVLVGVNWVYLCLRLPRD